MKSLKKLRIMENKWKWIYNPFEKVAGWKAFGIGIVILAITTVVGYLGSMVFYGLSAKVVPSITWSMACSLQSLGLAVWVVLMYLTALLFAKHVRFQDILGTLTLAKYPLLLMAIVNMTFGKSISSIDVKELLNGDYSSLNIVPLFIFGIIAMILLVWEIALMYNAFRVSANLKGLKCAVLFTTALLISEIILMVLVSYLY